MRSRWKRGAERNALGRSRGGFSTKINARTNAEGLPIGVVITPGQAHDVTAFPALMQEIDCDPEQMLGDKGYDSEAVRNDIEERGGEAAIPSTATRKIQHAVDKALYALRNRIERFFNRAKNSRRVATRYDKLIESFAAFVLLACIRIGLSLSTRPRANLLGMLSRITPFVYKEDFANITNILNLIVVPPEDHSLEKTRQILENIRQRLNYQTKQPPPGSPEPNATVPLQHEYKDRCMKYMETYPATDQMKANIKYP